MTARNQKLIIVFLSWSNESLTLTILSTRPWSWTNNRYTSVTED
jgi:hypothetical protein